MSETQAHALRWTWEGTPANDSHGPRCTHVGEWSIDDYYAALANGDTSR